MSWNAEGLKPVASWMNPPLSAQPWAPELVPHRHAHPVDRLAGALVLRPAVVGGEVAALVVPAEARRGLEGGGVVAGDEPIDRDMGDGEIVVEGLPLPHPPDPSAEQFFGGSVIGRVVVADGLAVELPIQFELAEFLDVALQRC